MLRSNNNVRAIRGGDLAHRFTTPVCPFLNSKDETDQERHVCT